MAYTTINKSSDHFNTVLYTGDGSASDRTITNVGFKPDWLWNKSRSNAYNHYIFDVLRGTNMISSNATTAQEDKSPQFSAFTSDGFTIRNDAGSLAINASGVTFANWCWKANGSGSANSDGSDSSTVSANTTAGFSIVKWTPSGGNATVGHGLGAVPEMIISFRIDGAQDRFVYHKDIGNTKYVRLNQTTASTTDANAWNNTTPTSSVFSVGSQFGGSDYIAYCFAEKKGFSKFGSYEGNGNTDGLFIYTGFKPAFVMIKSYNTASRFWTIQDNKRSSSGGPNPNDKWLYANTNDAEVDQASNPMDFLSNGFKLRNNGAYQNSNAYIYMAFAEAPLVGSNNVPCTAR